MASTDTAIALRLDIYERKLLDEFVRLYDEHVDDIPGGSAIIVDGVFSRWLWRRKVFDNFHDLIHQPKLIEDMSGNVEVIWPTYLHFLHYYIYNFLYFRTDTLRVDNPDIVDSIRNAVPELLDLNTKPAHGDLGYWRLISKLSFDNAVGVVDAEDMTLEQLVRSMRPPLRTVDEQEEWETTDDSQDGELVTIDDADADATRLSDIDRALREEAVDRRAPDIDWLEESMVRDHKLVGVEAYQERSDQDLENTSRLSRDNDEDAGSDGDDQDKIHIPFEIYALLRKVSILHRRQTNADLVFECVNDGEFGKYYVKAAEGVFVADPRPEALRTGLAAMTTHLGLITHLSIWGDQGFLVVDDPRTFIEYIPFNELRDVENSNSAEVDCVLWYPETPVPTMEHHLITEEVVFRYCVLNDFHFPDHLEGGQVAFVMSPLLDSNFVRELQLFWTKWSDCAITRDSESGEWILLETRPGRKFREIWAENDRLTALKYFRNIVNAERFEHRSQLRDYVGQSLQPRFSNLLEAVPFEELEVLDVEPLKGSRGAVYKAKWHCPHKIEMPEAVEQMVALKSLQSFAAEDTQELMNELEVTFEALKGLSVRMVKFLGITRSPADVGSSKLPPNTLFLVSEFASGGNGRELVESCLNGTPQDWDIILRLLGDIASGLCDIHSHGVLHRDLHWGNILGTTKRFDRQLLPMIRQGLVKNDEETSVELLIADLGEGKIIGRTSTIGRQYGNAEFRAPEVRKHGPSAYTSASDMYAMGRLAEDIVIEYWKASEKAGDCKRLISRTVRDMVTKLKSKDPGLRPSAEETRDALQNIWRKGMAGAWDFDPQRIDLTPYEEEVAEVSSAVKDEIP